MKSIDLTSLRKAKEYFSNEEEKKRKERIKNATPEEINTMYSELLKEEENKVEK